MAEAYAPIILLADDNEEDRFRLKRYLDSGGFAVLEAVGGEEAYAIAAKASTRIDLLVSDVRMPHLDGYGLANRIRRIRPDLKVLFVSGYSMEILALLKFRIDRASLINKSVDKDAFLGAVRRRLALPALASPGPSENPPNSGTV